MKSYKHELANGKLCHTQRLVMERHLGRRLLDNEIVHHRDGNILDNSVDNLQVLTRGGHLLEHLGGRTKSREEREKLRQANLGKRHSLATKRKLQKINREARPLAKLTPEDIPTIRKMLVDGIKQILIAWIYQVNYRSISAIKTGACWSWVA